MDASRGTVRAASAAVRGSGPIVGWRRRSRGRGGWGYHGRRSGPGARGRGVTMTQRQEGLDDRAAAVGPDLQVPPCLAGPLLHAEDPDPQGVRRLPLAGRTCDPVAVVPDLELHPVRRFSQTDLAAAAPGMPPEVGQAFLDDPEDRRLQVRRQARGTEPDPQADPDAAFLLQAAAVPAQGADQADLVEDRRMEEVRQAPELVHAVLEQPLAFRQVGRQGRTAPASERLEAELQAGELLGGRVVQLARDSAAFFLLRLEQAGRQQAQVGFELLPPAIVDLEFVVGLAESLLGALALADVLQHPEKLRGEPGEAGPT